MINFILRNILDDLYKEITSMNTDISQKWQYKKSADRDRSAYIQVT